MLLKWFVEKRLRQGTLAREDFFDSLRKYEKDNPSVTVDEAKAFKAFLEGRLDYNLKGIEKFYKN